MHHGLGIFIVVEKKHFTIEVAVRVGLNLETLTVILKPQSTVFLGRLDISA